jgi:hypothetical protein
VVEALTGAGQLSIEEGVEGALVSLSVDADADAEMTLLVTKSPASTALSEVDFIL